LGKNFIAKVLKDAVFLSKEIMAKVMELDLLGVWVTFIDELTPKRNFHPVKDRRGSGTARQKNLTFPPLKRP
jgi:hypothetical protein